MKPEREVEIKLWDWLKTKGNIKEVYFNSKNEVSAPIFKVEGIQKKPDLILKTQDDFGLKYCAVEVKDNSKSKNVKDSLKIIDVYFKNYIEKKTKYLINNSEIRIDHFLIATQKSPEGYLYKNETLTDNWLDKSSGKYNISRPGKYPPMIPRMEGERTYDFVRHLFPLYTSIRKKYEDNECSMGILIGNSEDEFNPYIQSMGFNVNKNKWGQRWWKI